MSVTHLTLPAMAPPPRVERTVQRSRRQRRGGGKADRLVLTGQMRRRRNAMLPETYLQVNVRKEAVVGMG